MRRHAALVPLSHDHHHALSEARRLHRGADGDPAARRAAAAGFLHFYSDQTVRHFREEEELLFPLLVDAPDPAGELLSRALLDHQRLHALVDRLGREQDDAALMREVADRLEEHVRFEERQLFPLLESLAAGQLESLDLRAAAGAAVDLLGPPGRGPVWGTATEDLNATLLVWPAGEGAAEHVNDSLDVLLIVLAGSVTLTIDGEPGTVRAGEAAIVEKGRSRRIEAGPGGARYLSVHRRRPPLQVAPAPRR